MFTILLYANTTYHFMQSLHKVVLQCLYKCLYCSVYTNTAILLYTDTTCLLASELAHCNHRHGFGPYRTTQTLQYYIIQTLQYYFIQCSIVVFVLSCMVQIRACGCSVPTLKQASKLTSLCLSLIHI